MNAHSVLFSLKLDENVNAKRISTLKSTIQSEHLDLDLDVPIQHVEVPVHLVYLCVSVCVARPVMVGEAIRYRWASKGETVELECEVDPDVDDARAGKTRDSLLYTWSFDLKSPNAPSRPVALHTVLDPKIQHPNGRTLIIKNFEQTDIGHYICDSNSGRGSAQTMSYYLYLSRLFCNLLTLLITFSLLSSYFFVILLNLRHLFYL